MSQHKCRDFLKTSADFAAGAFASRASLMFCLLIGAACGGMPAYADDLADCTQPRDMPRVIAGCTSLLAAPERSAQYLALVYRNRSAAYAAMGDFERAEQDRHQAIALNPDYQKTARDDDRDIHQLGAVGWRGN
jgi:hypothetical protein